MVPHLKLTVQIATYLVEHFLSYITNVRPNSIVVVGRCKLSFFSNPIGKNLVG